MLEKNFGSSKSWTFSLAKCVCPYRSLQVYFFALFAVFGFLPTLTPPPPPLSKNLVSQMAEKMQAIFSYLFSVEVQNLHCQKETAVSSVFSHTNDCPDGSSEGGPFNPLIDLTLLGDSPPLHSLKISNDEKRALKMLFLELIPMIDTSVTSTWVYITEYRVSSASVL